jgi:hypothetical protein
MGHFANDFPSSTDPNKIEGATMLVMEEALQLESALEGKPTMTAQANSPFTRGSTSMSTLFGY